jgi:hypothetical protein
MPPSVFDRTCDRRRDKVDNAGGAGVVTLPAAATFSNTPPGQTFTNPVSAFPAGNLDISTQPFIFSDCVMTWNGVTRQIRDLSLRVGNNVDRGRFLNSLTLTAVNKITRQITWSISLPSGDYDDLWDSGMGADGASLSAVFTNGGTALTLTSTSVRFPARNPDHPFQAEGFLTVEGEAYSLAGATPLAVTLDSTP